jgi:hypothetical protein
MSKVTLKHYGVVTKGKLVYFNPLLFLEVITQLEGKEFELVIKEKHKRVSTDAHGYYRAGIIGECLKSELFAGWEREDIHKHFSDMFLSVVTHQKCFDKKGNTIHKEVILKQSTADLSSKEMFEYCEKCIQWCAEEGIVIHTPEQYRLGIFKTI